VAGDAAGDAGTTAGAAGGCAAVAATGNLVVDGQPREQLGVK
jgi:hypothetical protein